METATLNVFVYHAWDAAGRCLASVIRDCDAPPLRFDYLVIASTESERRMVRFLATQGLRYGDHVVTPFLVLLGEDATQRTVLHGPLLHEWLSNLVDAYLQSAFVAPPRVRERNLLPYLPAYLMRLVLYGCAEPSAPHVTDDANADQAAAYDHNMSQDGAVAPPVNHRSEPNHNDASDNDDAEDDDSPTMNARRIVSDGPSPAPRCRCGPVVRAAPTVRRRTPSPWSAPRNAIA